MTSREVTFLGVTTTIDPLSDRAELQRRAESGEITPVVYYRLLKATWADMTDTERVIDHNVDND